MGQNWIRDWGVSAGGITIGPGSDLRVVFDCKTAIVGTPANATICLYNLAPDTANTLMSAAGKTVTLNAGYKEGFGIIFSGQAIQVNKGKANPTDTTCTIYASGNDLAHNTAHVSATLKAGSTGLDVFNVLIKTMPSLQAGHIPTAALQAIKYPRAITLFGMTKHHMHTLANSVNSVFHYDNVDPKLHITPVNSATGYGDDIVLGPGTGLVGMPTQNASGINARCLLNPAIRKESIVKIDSSLIQHATPDFTVLGKAGGQDLNNAGFSQVRGDISADGRYKVLSIEHVGDSRGDPWYCELNCMAVGGHPTDSQAATSTFSLSTN